MSKKLTQDDINRAYQKLNAKEKEVIDELCQKMERGVKARWNRIQRVHPLFFGKVQALELLAKLGIWMIEEEYGKF